MTHDHWLGVAAVRGSLELPLLPRSYSPALHQVRSPAVVAKPPREGGASMEGCDGQKRT